MKLDRYNFEFILKLMTYRYQLNNCTDRPVPNGLRYFSRLEQFLNPTGLQGDVKKLAYISRN